MFDFVLSSLRNIFWSDIKWSEVYWPIWPSQNKFKRCRLKSPKIKSFPLIFHKADPIPQIFKDIHPSQKTQFSWKITHQPNKNHLKFSKISTKFLKKSKQKWEVSITETTCLIFCGFYCAVGGFNANLSWWKTWVFIFYVLSVNKISADQNSNNCFPLRF